MTMHKLMHNAMLLALVAAVLLVAGGCQSNGSDRHDDDDDHGMGRPTEVMVQMSDVPANVRQAFERQFPSARVKEIEKETYPNGTVHWGFEFVNKDGKEMEVEFDADGERLDPH